MRYLYEMHFHTAEVSRCAGIPAAQGVSALKDAGYSGVCVTDHFHLEYLESLGPLPYDEKIARYLAGYESAKMLETQNFKVFLGMELRLEGSHNDYLLYGISRSLLLNTPALASFTVRQCKIFADRHGLFFAQAHPFRPDQTPVPPHLLHGLEVYNANPKHDNRNVLAQEYAQKHRLTAIAGSDSHLLSNTAQAGVWFKELHSQAGALALALRKREICGLMVSD